MQHHTVTPNLTLFLFHTRAFRTGKTVNFSPLPIEWEPLLYTCYLAHKLSVRATQKVNTIND